jgi:hypothetical protein
MTGALAERSGHRILQIDYIRRDANSVNARPNVAWLIER